MHKIAASLVGAASVSASLLVLRPPLHPGTLLGSAREPEPALKGIHAGETVPAEISLRRLRELGL